MLHVWPRQYYINKISSLLFEDSNSHSDSNLASLHTGRLLKENVNVYWPKFVEGFTAIYVSWQGLGPVLLGAFLSAVPVMQFISIFVCSKNGLMYIICLAIAFNCIFHCCDTCDLTSDAIINEVIWKHVKKVLMCRCMYFAVNVFLMKFTRRLEASTEQKLILC